MDTAYQRVGFFEDMMQRYKQSSEEKMSDIKRGVDSNGGSGESRKDF